MEKQATEKQIKYANEIAKALKLKMPDDVYKKSISDFIKKNKIAFFKTKYYQNQKREKIESKNDKTKKKINKKLKIKIPSEKEARDKISAFEAKLQSNKKPKLTSKTDFLNFIKDSLAKMVKKHTKNEIRVAIKEIYGLEISIKTLSDFLDKRKILVRKKRKRKTINE